MNIIQYIKLYHFLAKEEHLSGKALRRTITRIRELPREFKGAVSDLLKGLIPDISIQDVSLEQLMNRDGMSPIRGLLFLDWLRREPANALRYMAFDTLSSAMPPLAEEQNKKLKENLNRLSKNLDEKDRKRIEEQFELKGMNDTSDIKCD